MRLPASAVNTDNGIAKVTQGMYSQMGDEYEAQIEAMEAAVKYASAMPRRLLLVLGATVVVLAPRSIQTKFFKKPILDDRNLVAIRHLDEASPHHVMMIWGAGHVPGIYELLTQQGYWEIDREWQTALSLGDVFL